MAATYVPPSPPASSVRVSAVLGTTGDAVLGGNSTTYGTDRTAALQGLINQYAAG